MSLFGKMFGKKETSGPAPVLEPLTVYTPINGNAIPLNQIPDPVFSEGVLGPGCGIEPSSERVCAPFNGTISTVSETKHAVGITSPDGMEMLIHVGIDTVDMNGKGFDAKVKPGQKVNMGDVLLTFSLAEIKAAGHPSTTAVLVTNADDLGKLELIVCGEVHEGMPLMNIAK